VVGGGYSLLCAVVLAGSFRMVVDILGRGRHPCSVSPFYCFPAKLLIWIDFGLSCWAFNEFGPMSWFWALPQSKYEGTDQVRRDVGEICSRYMLKFDPSDNLWWNRGCIVEPEDDEDGVGNLSHPY
jgi:hypothetical protein